MLRFWTVVVGCCLALSWGTARAAEAILYEPAPSWVKPVEIPQAATDGGAVQLLLVDVESYYGAKGEEHYDESAIRVLNSQGLQLLGNIVRIWNPATETLAIHKAEILRDGKTIDLLAGGSKFEVLRQERNMNLAMLDGRLTAAFQIEDLRIGDIVHVSMTVRRNDPTMAGKADYVDAVTFPLPRSRQRFREVWDKSRKIRWRATEGFGDPTVTQTPLGTELVVDRRDVESPEGPEGAPARFQELGTLEISEFADWKDLSSLFAPLFDKAAQLPAGSPVKAEAAKIKATSSDPTERAAAALRLVQDQVRYLFVSVGQGGYSPAAADQTWSRRFGDCKGKTALLIALLQEMGIKAEPALVSSEAGDGMDARLPRASAFDHVIVRTEIGGKVYWLDGARIGDRNLAEVPTPAFRWALPLRAGGAKLEKLEIAAPTKPLSDWVLKIDATSGLDVEGPASLETSYRGDQAIVFQQAVAAVPKAQALKALKDSWQQEMPWLKIDSIDFGFDEQQGVMRVTAKGKGKVDWNTDRDSRSRQYVVESSGYADEFEQRKPGPHADAPFALTFPYYARTETRVRLPREGAGFTIVGDDTDQTVSGVRVTRTSKIIGDEAVVVTTRRTVQAEISAEEAYATKANVKKLPTSAFALIRAPRGFAATEAELDTLVKQRPDNAQAYVERGYALESRGKLDEALADYEKAVSLDKKNGYALRGRAQLKWRKGDLNGALADATAAIEMQPNEAGYVMRSWILDQAGRTKEAIADLDVSEKKWPPSGDLLVRRAWMYNKLADYPRAVADIDSAIAKNPDDVTLRQARVAVGSQNASVGRAQSVEALSKLIDENPSSYEALNRRAMLHLRDNEFELALADVDKSLQLKPTAAAYQIKGMLLDRKKDVAGAKAAYDALIAQDPSADSFVSRGAFRLGQNDRDGADADFMQALKIDPENFAAYSNHLTVEGMRHPEASQDNRYDEMVRKFPRSRLALLNRAVSLDNKEKYDEAIADYLAALKLPGTDLSDAPIYARMAATYEEAGRFKEALEAYDHVSDRDQQPAGFYNDRCSFKAIRNLAADTAVADCDRAIALAPDVPEYLSSRAFAHLRLGEFAKAIADYDAAIAKHSRTAEVLFGRGLAKRQSGDRAGGDADVAAAVKINPKIAEKFSSYGLK